MKVRRTGTVKFAQKSLNLYLEPQPSKEEILTTHWIKRNITILDSENSKESDATNAFGEIDFENRARTNAKYVRVGHKTDPGLLYHLLTKIWKVQKTNLVISVTGSAKNFQIASNIKSREIFGKSLVKCAESTGAWITSGGTNSGVMRMLGKSIKDYSTINSKGKTIPAIGIASWGVIADKDVLTNHDGNGYFPVSYDSQISKYDNRVSLDSNHTHFILVDDGSVNQYGREIKLRSALEAYIGSKTENYAEIQVICILLQGGPGSLETATENLKHKIPVVLVKGSGGWADVLSILIARKLRNITSDDLSDVLKEAKIFSWSPDLLQHWTNLVNVCLSHSQFITLFNLDISSIYDFDIAILKALLSGSNHEDQQYLFEQQMELAMAWNRCDIAKKYICNGNITMQWNVMERLFFKALCQNKADFSDLILDQLHLKLHNTQYYIVDLYKSLSKRCVVSKLLEDEEYNYEAILRLTHQIMGPEYVIKNPFENGQVQVSIRSASSDENILNRSNKLRYSSSLGANSTYDPYKEIFQWSILANYRKLAMIIWQRLNDPLPSAIAACRMLRELATYCILQDEQNSLLEHAIIYEDTAIELLSELFQHDLKRTHLLLIRQLPKWGDLTCLSIATSAKAKRLLAQPAFQTLLDQIWRGRLHTSIHEVQIVLAVLFPPAINNLKIVSHESYEDEEEEIEYDEEVDGFYCVDHENSETDESSTKASYWEKCVCLYSAPVTTFIWNVISTLTFLFLFAHTILTNFRPMEPSITEYVLYVWVLSLYTEEIRQVFYERGKHFIRKISSYFWSIWNIIDNIAFALFVAGIVLRFLNGYYTIARIVLSLSFSFYCIGTIHFFETSRILGPKIVMVGKMLKDLVFFMLLILIFLVAYGVASQAILYPNEDRPGVLIMGIFYKAYWHIYGELFLDEVNYHPETGNFACSSNMTLIHSGHPRCPEHHVIVTIMAAIYVLLANVLLLNLLIAMFSNTVERIEQNTDIIWRFQKIRTIQHNYSKSGIPAPLVCIPLAIRLMRHLFRRANGSTTDWQNHAFAKSLKPTELKKLVMWERWHTDMYIHKLKSKSNQTAEFKINEMVKRLDKLTSAINGLNERMDRLTQNTQ